MKIIIENVLWDDKWMVKASFVERIFGVKIPRTVRAWNKMGVNHPKYLTKHHKWRLKLSIKLSGRDRENILYFKTYRKKISLKKYRETLQILKLKQL